jgi:hypothetical protein
VTVPAGLGAEPTGGPLGNVTIAEAVVLMLTTTRKGELAFEWNMPAAAALIELVLAGRVGSVPNTSFFNEASPRKLVVLDTEPTGASVLDAAVRILESTPSPLRPAKAVAAVRREVTLAVYASLESRGMAHAVGDFPSRGHLRIDDEEGYTLERARFAVIRSHPEKVTDARTGAFIDVLRNGAPSSTGEQGVHPRIRWEWYPQDARETIDAILMAENILFTSD